MSQIYLRASKQNLSKGLFEPAMANGIHALELAMKAALILRTSSPTRTHNVGGLFGKHFRKELGKDLCRSANLVLTKYNLPRYPGQRLLDEEEVAHDVAFVDEMINNHIRRLLE